jgi:hypothetical protein
MLIQNPFLIWSSYGEICSLFNSLQIHILFLIFGAREGHFWSNQIQISLEI